MCREALIFGAEYFYHPSTYRHQLWIGPKESFQKIYIFYTLPTYCLRDKTF